ncbi:MAG: bifunctional phosphoribosylaminoimidazolecarboxamide formyltransferase/IMP cyclohydrolase [Chlorobi bacterium]|nr:bifunctional phosphoribosylaminoimidazolecarboxamide formyltransferase/IMP cyclohydrolase [Chlorobiota bacterium]MCI0716912.1 bifunctional phosphoribosylaminoimidazolecarboxamide formyltransferase/IMP cyclohydrolase [Chlorobiota bacterium]
MKRALISVYDKSAVAEFAKELVSKGFEIVSTSGTAKLLRENGIKLTTIEEITGSPEVLGGRVKTLQHMIFAGILADKSNPSHLKEAEKYGFKPFDLVCVNLYPFKETISNPDCTAQEAIEQIDIGGVSLIRAAAKNFADVGVIVHPLQYKIYIDALEKNKNINQLLAADAFEFIASYDISIANYFRKISGQKSGIFDIYYTGYNELRYGENPHQKAVLYNIGEEGFDKVFEKLHGRELSYINILDIDAAYNLINEFDQPACAIIKHTNPSGVACDDNITKAYLKALACDNVSRFGGIIIINNEMDLKTAQEIDKIKTDIVIAPKYSDDAFNFLLKKKNRQLIKCILLKGLTVNELKTVTGGMLMQTWDDIVVNESELKVVTQRKPTDDEIRDMIFAMKVCKHTKSNSVVYAKNLQTVGIGGGQPSRVDSSILAVQKAKRFGMDLQGSSVASDAFFPFPDGVIEAAKAGAKAVIQPGGSVKDDEVIKAANENGLTMVFTGIRHFKH